MYATRSFSDGCLSVAGISQSRSAPLNTVRSFGGSFASRSWHVPDRTQRVRGRPRRGTVRGTPRSRATAPRTARPHRRSRASSSAAPSRSHTRSTGPARRSQAVAPGSRRPTSTPPRSPDPDGCRAPSHPACTPATCGPGGRPDDQTPTPSRPTPSAHTRPDTPTVVRSTCNRPASTPNRSIAPAATRGAEILRVDRERLQRPTEPIIVEQRRRDLEQLVHRRTRTPSPRCHRAATGNTGGSRPARTRPHRPTGPTGRCAAARHQRCPSPRARAGNARPATTAPPTGGSRPSAGPTCANDPASASSCPESFSASFRPRFATTRCRTLPFSSRYPSTSCR